MNACQCVLAGLLAATTRIGANCAMFMFVPEPRAFISAQPTGSGACPQHFADDFKVRAGLARRNGCCNSANVGAIKIEPNALPQFLNAVFAEAGISAARADQGAIAAFADAANERLIDAALHVGVCARDSCIHIQSPSADCAPP